VAAYDENEPILTLSNRDIHKADVIVDADGEWGFVRHTFQNLTESQGIKSLAREIVLGFEDKPKSSGYACFRAYFKGAYLKEDPLCREFVEKERVNIWIGNDVHLVQNTLRDGGEFNWIITHKDTEERHQRIMVPVR
jgi:salicylate hydroxylase